MITVAVIQGSQFRPLLSVVRSGCSCLAQISQGLVRLHIHCSDDGRLDMASIKKPREMIITDNRGAISEMRRNRLFVLRYQLPLAGIALSCMRGGITETAYPSW